MNKPRKVDRSWMPVSRSSGRVDMKAIAEPTMPDMGCVMCWSIEVQ